MQVNQDRAVRTGFILFSIPLLAVVASAQQGGATNIPPATGSVRSPEVVVVLPDSPGSTVAKLRFNSALSEQTPSTSNSSSAPSTSTAPPPATPQSSQSATQSSQRPVGTAAAEPTHANGIAASEPAGVAIAPGKQRRARTIVIGIGAILGAGVAIGSVAALTAGTSSRPPGAH
jgi:cytoskeletal protein RodZ